MKRSSELFNSHAWGDFGYCDSYLKRIRGWSWRRCCWHLPGVGACAEWFHTPPSRTAVSLHADHVQHSVVLCRMLWDSCKNSQYDSKHSLLGNWGKDKGWVGLDVTKINNLKKKKEQFRKRHRNDIQSLSFFWRPWIPWLLMSFHFYVCF